MYIVIDKTNDVKSYRFHCEKCGMLTRLDVGLNDKIASKLCVPCEERAVRRALKLK